MGVFQGKDRFGKTHWYASKYWPDKTRTRVRCPNDTFAKKVQKMMDGSVIYGNWQKVKTQLTRNTLDNPTIKDFAEVYYEEYCLVANRRPDFKRQALNQIVRLQGRVRLQNLSGQQLKQFQAMRLAEGVTQGTVASNLAVYRNMISFALAQGYLEKDPFAGLKVAKNPEKALRIMTPEEVGQLVEAVAAENWLVGAFTAVIAETGLRLSEARRMEWSHLNFQTRLLSVGLTKGGKSRVIPLSEEAVSWLKRITRIVGSPFVFAWPKKERNVRRGRAMVSPREAFNRGKDEAGLPWVHGFHDLRHYRATMWLALGVDVKAVQVLLGHAHLATTERYTHYIPERATTSVQEAFKAEARERTERAARETQNRRQTGIT